MATLLPDQTATKAAPKVDYLVRRHFKDGRQFVIYQGSNQASAELRWRQVKDLQQAGKMEWWENGKLRDVYEGL